MKYPLLAEFDEFVHRRGRLFNQSWKTEMQKNIIQATLNAHLSSYTITMEREREGRTPLTVML